MPKNPTPLHNSNLVAVDKPLPSPCASKATSSSANNRMPLFEVTETKAYGYCAYKIVFAYMAITLDLLSNEIKRGLFSKIIFSIKQYKSFKAYFENTLFCNEIACLWVSVH